MNEQERQRTRVPRPAGGSPGNDGDQGLEASRRRAERLLQASDEVIARALSDDSEKFLRATRQSGGQ